MILQALLLGVLLALAFLSRKVRAFALILAFSVVATFAAEMAQTYLTPPEDDPLLFYKIPSYSDAFVFSAVSIVLIGERLRWWGLALCGAACVTLAYDGLFWWTYYLGVSGDPYYVPVLQGLFLISVAILAFAGGNDVIERVGSLLASFRDVLVRPAGIGWARSLHRKKVLEERA